MSLSERNLTLVFFVVFLCQCISCSLFSIGGRICFAAPLLVMMVYQKPPEICIWGGFLMGALLDMMISDSRFGTYALSYTATSFLLYSLRRFFFADSLSTLPIMVFFFSVLSTMIHLVLIVVLDKPMQVGVSWLITDFLVFPFLDSLYGFILFIMPYLLLGKKPRAGKEYFLR